MRGVGRGAGRRTDSERETLSLLRSLHLKQCENSRSQHRR